MISFLIVDDSVLIRTLIRQTVERLGHTVVGEAQNGEDAVRLFRINKPDIVTMDLTMPKMGGAEAIKKIREIDPQSRIIVISSAGTISAVKECYAYGAINFLVKPFDENALIKAINNVKLF